MVHYVYIIRCKDGTYYTGLTSNLQRRIKQHRNGEAKSTKYRRPVSLQFFCGFPNKKKAAAFEQYLKSHSGKAFLSKRLVIKK